MIFLVCHIFKLINSIFILSKSGLMKF